MSRKHRVMPKWDLVCIIGGREFVTQEPGPNDVIAAMQLQQFPDSANVAALGKSLLNPNDAANDPQLTSEQWGKLLVAVFTYRALRLVGMGGAQ